MPTIYLATSLDVEEEGLFTGSYAQRDVQVTNTQALLKLKPLLNLGLKPTLFCAYPVFKDLASCKILATLRDQHACEIGAHLHYWNTPPLIGDHVLHKVPAVSLSQDIFAAKLETLLNSAKELQASPITSFRMGRWDIHAKHFDLLAHAGITCDASVRPLHTSATKEAGPNHFHAKASPYWIPTLHGKIFEVPLTVTPLFSYLPNILDNLERCLPNVIAYLKARMNYWGALALLPVYQPLAMLKLITWLYIKRGGRLLSLTWHSSEMQPGATPHLATPSLVAKFLERLQAYFTWLFKNYHVVSLPMGQLADHLGASANRRL